VLAATNTVGRARRRVPFMLYLPSKMYMLAGNVERL
jgi:hypothetical protein